MSDPGWCGKHNYRSQTTDAVCPHCKRERESAAEIEWLRSDLAVAQSLARVQAEKTVVAEKRIEELERPTKVGSEHLGSWISTAQIDAAWAEWSGVDCEDCHSTDDLFKILGIVRCDCLKWEHINGVCQMCNGHGWVMKGDE